MPTREVHCEDALEWLKAQGSLSNCSLVASLPDISEFPKLNLSEWKEWFETTAELVLSRTPADGVTVFYQSDIKLDGAWVDKGHLIQKAAERRGHSLLWHKIVCRAPVGMPTFGRPSYSHMLAFSQTLKLPVANSTADVLAEAGEKTWPRGMGLEACQMIARFIKQETTSTTVVQPFCGEGAMLAIANHWGLDGVGIERSPKRAEKARQLQLNSQGALHASY